MASTRVLVIEDHEIVVDGLRWMLDGEDSLDIVGHASSAGSAMEMIRVLRPDVLLLDLHLSDRGGPEVVGHFVEGCPSTPIVVFTAHDEPEYVEEAIAAGAVGYLLKSASREEMVRAIQAAVSGGGYIQAEVVRPLMAKLGHESRSAPRTPVLTPRETDVVRLLAEGMSNKVIASRLNLAEATVKGYIRNIYEKLGAVGRAEAVSIALRNHLIE